MSDIDNYPRDWILPSPATTKRREIVAFLGVLLQAANKGAIDKYIACHTEYITQLLRRMYELVGAGSYFNVEAITTLQMLHDNFFSAADENDIYDALESFKHPCFYFDIPTPTYEGVMLEKILSHRYGCGSD